MLNAQLGVWILELNPFRSLGGDMQSRLDNNNKTDKRTETVQRNK